MPEVNAAHSYGPRALGLEGRAFPNQLIHIGHERRMPLQGRIGQADQPHE